MEKFEAYVVRRDAKGLTGQIEKRAIDQLPEGDVLVKVHYSGVNYKDGLATLPESKVVKDYPIVPGIDLAGEVVQSSHPDFREGDLVLCTGYDQGTSHDGGFSKYARLPADWLLPLPEGLTPREAMGIGTAGFTAALSVDRLLHCGVTPELGPVLVTGATGGVGSFAVDMLSKAGFSVTASTGKSEQQKEWLTSLGAANVIGRDEIVTISAGPLGKQRWAGVVDPVGGPHLEGLFKNIRYGGAIALSGLTGGIAFEGTVFPFILRGVQLLGIDSAYCPKEWRSSIWRKLGREWKPERALSEGIRECTLQDLPEVLQAILQGKAVGRTVVRLA
ncbi:acryloyl-CoA reductase [Paenibacillus sp.]|jgi:putative YhdH/YhfP family quinone oxidoreductase|uniref:acrylyl-CoA reductase family protein n=1 Tax=Paenibacillus sp. TaxID=58172 RepID=UPI002818D866|nr:acryloyl-CoA reductase [Paenibacillus sp.]MDR0269405.1 acryloyl-CoA reductase [Paenibacillus sp.]